MTNHALKSFAQWRAAEAAGRPACFVAEAGTATEKGWLPASAWQKAEEMPFQFLDGSGDQPQAPTRARLLSREGLLFLRFECRDPDVAHLVYTHTGRDPAALWQDDIVEFFLQPREGGTRYHLMFNPGGGSYDALLAPGAKAEDPSWDPPLRSRIVTTTEGWTLEIALPLAACADAASATTASPVWRAKFQRSRQGREGAWAEDTGWCAAGAPDTGDHAPLGFLYLEALTNGRPPSAAQVAPGTKPGRPPVPFAEIGDVLRGKYRRPVVTVDAGTNAVGSFRLVPLSTTFVGTCESTDVEVRREATGLRLRVRCAERDPRTIVARSKGTDIWFDDSIEVFLAPGRRESDEYLQAVVNAAGMIHVSRGKKTTEARDVQATVTRGANAWTVDLWVPFAALDLRPGRIPALWGMNVTRNRPARSDAADQSTVWSRFPLSSHDPATFGTLWLADGDLFPDLGAPADLAVAARQGREIDARLAAETAGARGGAHPIVDSDVFSMAERAERALPDTVERYLCKVRDQVLAERDKAWDAVKTAEDARQLQARIRESFLCAIGGLPTEKGPLNPRVSVVFENDELRVERLIFESRPRFYVTANVFVPKPRGTRRLPVVLRLVGHATNGRFGALKFCEELARDGYLAMTIDMTGQGERIYVNNGLGSRTPTSNHYAEGAACFLTGGNLAGYMIYDVMRAIDYLETRDEADMRRVVLTGESGGGTMTEYVTALDSRIFAAAPVSSGWSLRRGSGNYDSEQVLSGFFAGALDIEGLGVLAVPRPYCVIFEANETRRTETEHSFAIARRIAALLTGTPDAGARLQYMPTSAPHGYGKTHYDIFRQWLARIMPPNPDGPRVVGKTEVVREACRASRTGRMFYSRDLPDRETTMTLNTKRIALASAFDQSVTTRAAATERAARLRDTLRNLLALGDAPIVARAVETRGVVTNGDVIVEKLVLETDPGVPVPALLLASRAAPPSGAAVVWIASRGKRGVLEKHADAVRATLAAGTRILIPDLRGMGETSVGADTSFLGDEASLHGMSIQLQRSLLGMRVRDALCCVAYLRSRADVDARRIGLLGDSLADLNPPRFRQPRLISDEGLESLSQAESLGPVTALLSFVLDTNVAQGAMCGLPDSYEGICHTPYFFHPFTIFIPGILQTCDLADLCAAAAPRPLLLAGSVNALNQRLDQTGEDATAFERVRRGYELQDAAARLTIAPAAGIARAAAFVGK